MDKQKTGRAVPPVIGRAAARAAQLWNEEHLHTLIRGVQRFILCALLKLTKSALKDWLCWLVALSAAALSLFTGLSNILIVVLGAAAGLLAMEVKTRHDLH